MKQYVIVQMSRKDVIDMMLQSKLNPDPIGQRPPVPGRKKSQDIVEASIKRFFMGVLIVRDISNDAEAQKIYPGVKWLIIDGGHRSRAYRDYYLNKFDANGDMFNTLDDREREEWLNQAENVCVYECTPLEATEIFRTVNKSTEVNQIEMLMAHETSNFAKVVRSQTKRYYEYRDENQRCHPLFEVAQNRSGDLVPTNFAKAAINPRRGWDKWVAFALGRIIHGGVIDYPILNNLTDDTELVVSKADHQKLKDFLDLAHYCVPARGYTGAKLAAFYMVYFKMKGKVVDKKVFKRELWKAMAAVTGTTNSKYYDEDARASFRTMLNNYFDDEGITKLANAIIELMDLPSSVVNTAKRTISKSEKVEMLELQGGVCAIDGEPLDIEDAVFGHDLAYSKGGSEGVIIRKCYNQEMGTLSIEEYKKAKGYTH